MDTMLYTILAIILFNSCKNDTQIINADHIQSKQMNTNTYKEGKDYLILQRHRLLDYNGYQQAVEASSFLLPKGWTYEGGITWQWGKCLAETVKLKFQAKSADGSMQIVGNPVKEYIYNDNPLILKAILDLPFSGCEVAKPFTSSEYIQNSVTPFYNAEVISISSNARAEAEYKRNAERMNSQMQGYGTGTILKPFASLGHLKLKDGNEAIVICNVLQTISYTPDMMNGGTNSTIKTNVGENTIVIFPSGKKAEAEKILSILKSSTRVHPQWLKDVTDLFSGIVRNEQVQTSNRQAVWYNASQETNKAIVRNWEVKSNTDRVSEAWSQTIRDVETYKDNEGNSYELSSGYQSAWTARDGSILLSAESNFDPNVAFGETWNALKKR